MKNPNNTTTASKAASRFAAIVAACAIALPASLSASQPASPITHACIEQAQTQWTAGLIEVSRTHREGGNARAIAAAMLSRLYHLEAENGILFKPTLTFGERTFRPTKEAALAYFVGGNPAFPDDDGFALKPFTEARFQIANTFIHGDVAIAMGNVWIRDVDGNEVMVDKTFGYVRDAAGDLRIVLHHSSLPFTPAAG